MIGICVALFVGIWIGLILDAYLVTRHKPRPARKPTEEEENDLLWTSPLTWVKEAADAVVKLWNEHHKGES